MHTHDASSIWPLVVKYCIENGRRWAPGVNGEPWVALDVASEFTGQEIDTLQRKLGKARSHPNISGLYKMTDLEIVE